MIGYRTYLVAVATMLAGLLARYGFKVDPAVIADTAIIVIPALMTLMRSVTHSSPGQKP